MGCSLMKNCYTNYSEDLKGKNPDPSNFKIIKYWIKHYNKEVYTILRVNYPNCTNYEGDKILVFKGHRNDILNTRYLDPHFSKAMDSPIMRINPSEEGLSLINSIFSGRI